MTESTPYLPFSQRTGLEPIPPQLKLGQVSEELRRLLYFAIHLEISRNSVGSYDGEWFGDNWKRVLMDLHVRLLRKEPDSFRNKPSEWDRLVKQIIYQVDMGSLFNLIEFFLRHRGSSAELKSELAAAFVDSRAAYRVLDNQCIGAIGTDEQRLAFERAIADAEAKSALAARKHMISAAVALRNGDWAGSVRESIHAVESAAVQIAPTEHTLGAALRKIKKHGHLHGSLSTAFEKLYGYASDEHGVRHALVFGDEVLVDEVDALFMLGACASFVSYLLARVTLTGERLQEPGKAAHP
jgi:hypothetical protein